MSTKELSVNVTKEEREFFFFLLSLHRFYKQQLRAGLRPHQCAAWNGSSRAVPLAAAAWWSPQFRPCSQWSSIVTVNRQVSQAWIESENHQPNKIAGYNQQPQAFSRTTWTLPRIAERFRWRMLQCRIERGRVQAAPSVMLRHRWWWLWATTQLRQFPPPDSWSSRRWYKW